jgi:hypothetical protein
VRLLAVLLLAFSPGDSLPHPTPETFAQIAPPLRKFCLDNELLDPRETRYVLARPEEFATDLLLLGRRYRDLIDAPPASDAARFPGRETIDDALAFNRHYREHLAAVVAVDLARGEELQEAIRETDRLYRLYDAMRDARTEYYYIPVRRAALKTIRDTIGPDAYYTGNLPPYAPIWLFQRAN